MRKIEKKNKWTSKSPFSPKKRRIVPGMTPSYTFFFCSLINKKQRNKKKNKHINHCYIELSFGNGKRISIFGGKFDHWRCTKGNLLCSSSEHHRILIFTHERRRQFALRCHSNLVSIKKMIVLFAFGPRKKSILECEFVFYHKFIAVLFLVTNNKI